MPDSGNPRYGYAPKGIRCVEITRYHQTPSVTLNLMISTRGVEYTNTLDGASSGVDFVNFFDEASQNVHENGEPILKAGDTIVVDNCPTHHAHPARVLRRWLDEQGIELLNTPKYSPEFNFVTIQYGK